MSEIPPPQEQQEKVDLSKLHRAPKNQMFIVDGKWEPLVFICQIHCSCGNLFGLRIRRKLDKVQRIQCRECGFRADLDSLIRDWGERETPVEKKKQEESPPPYHGQKFREF